MSKFVRIMKSPRVIIALVVMALCILAINPNPFAEGVAVRTVERDSAASLAGIVAPQPNIPPRARERILSVDGIEVNSEADYYDSIGELELNQTLSVRTNKKTYYLTTQPLVNETMVGSTTEERFNETLNATLNVTVPVINRMIIGVQGLGMSVYPAPTNNIRRGLDLSGGTRVLLKPEKELSSEDMTLVIENIKQRLNAFGLSDVVVRPSNDLAGTTFILVEIAGANREEVRDLLARQGKFEAKVGEDTVFRGGSDITYVCTSAECSGLDPQVGCQEDGTQAYCGFRFSISLSGDAAKRHAAITGALNVDPESGGSYLEKSLDLYLDDELVDSLRIGADLRGRDVTDISISGSGTGLHVEEAQVNAFASMKRLQTILKTGSLPVKLEVVKMDAISPALGRQFTRNAVLVSLACIATVALIILVRYRKIAVSAPMLLCMVAEALIILGFAAVAGWNIDLAAVAGIIIAIGTGVDHQIVIIDEAVGRRDSSSHSWKERMKKAFFIIMAAYATSVVAMIPLYFAGAGLLKGFALTSIIGVTIGVFITRPMYAAMIKILVEKA